MDRKKELKKQYKENPPAAGIFKITNLANGKIFIGRGVNLQGVINGQQVRLQGRMHINKELQQDWDHFGSNQFEFEILDYLKPTDDLQVDIQEELAELERLWLDKLKPFGAAGYNKPEK